MTQPLLSIALLGALAGAPTQPGPKPTYRVAANWPVGGEGGWDYIAVDHAGGRVYASHATQVEVLDLANGHPVGIIPNTAGVHGIVVAQGRGYISCGKTNSVVEFDPQTLRVTASVPAGAKPDALCYDEFSKRVFVFNNGATTATVLDAATGQPVGTAELGGAPEAGVSDGKGTVFVNLEDKNEIVAFDAKTLAVRHRWPVGPGEEPSGLALDRAHRRLFSVCGNEKMVVLDADTGRPVAVLPIGSGVDGVVFDDARQVAISSNGSGTVTVVHEEGPEKFTVAQTLATARGARTLALDAATHRLYLPTADLGPAPAPTPAVPHPRLSTVPNTFRVLVLE
ncbi:PQQ-binding-like beta-propeller repeat protein [Hymenobacter nivis]|uniref:YncE family protein n=1 Tax=Hymenobacter nivis TaxID=1850093 RepID=A0A502GWN9_9BACT|nr:PQQ-binding-like beta-propeller repeat protein [Hymenobacter nivis]TPG66401.1 YncE family protein [Hymenobacter nivis]